MHDVALHDEEDAILFKPILHTGRPFYITLTILLAVMGWAFVAYMYQMWWGLGVTGMNRPTYWGVYITNFVFFIGVSHAGTLISAILRICKAEWRRPITRAAEVITVVVLFIGAANVVFDIGRPDRAYKVIFSGHLRSPLLWDVISVTTYLICSTIYLYMPLIPDVALLRDRVQKRKWLYRILALGWQNTPRQHHILERCIGVMALVVLPVAVSVHTVVSWVFGMTIQPMWHSTIFGPYFVAGAIFSGIAAIIVLMAVLRKAYHLEDYLKPIHFNYLGQLLLVMTLLWFYFTLAENLTTYYGAEPAHLAVFYSKFSGHYAPLFWSMVGFCFVIPMIILSNSHTRTITGTVIASLSINIGMYLERYTIVVPTLVNPRLPYPRGIYTPTWVEWSILAGCFAAFILAYVLFTKLFPIVSIWEVREGREKSLPEVAERLREYLPGSTAS
jgi:Ni/Fe-hydrogenase subunit HybB-like protein